MAHKTPEFHETQPLSQAAGTETQMDPGLATPRLKEALIPSHATIRLRVEQGGPTGHVFDLSSGGVFLIGREGADIALDDTKVSRKHAEIGLYGPGAYILRDLASTNGTSLNGKRVGERARLAHGDLISVGDTDLRLEIAEASVEDKDGYY